MQKTADTITKLVIDRIHQEHPKDETKRNDLFVATINALIAHANHSDPAKAFNALRPIFEHLIDTLNDRPLHEPQHKQDNLPDSLIATLKVVPSDLFPSPGQSTVLSPNGKSSLAVSRRLSDAIKKHAEQLQLPTSRITQLLMNEIMIAVSLYPPPDPPNSD